MLFGLCESLVRTFELVKLLRHVSFVATKSNGVHFRGHGTLAGWHVISLPASDVTIGSNLCYMWEPRNSTQSSQCLAELPYAGKGWND